MSELQSEVGFWGKFLGKIVRQVIAGLAFAIIAGIPMNEIPLYRWILGWTVMMAILNFDF